MYDVYLQRRAVINEMREMAARPFAQVQLNTDAPLLDNEQPQPVNLILIQPIGSKISKILPGYAFCKDVWRFSQLLETNWAINLEFSI